MKPRLIAWSSSVGNEFDFDDPSDYNLGNGAQHPISGTSATHHTTITSSNSLDPPSLGKLEVINTHGGSLMSSPTFHGQPFDYPSDTQSQCLMVGGPRPLLNDLRQSQMSITIKRCLTQLLNDVAKGSILPPKPLTTRAAPNEHYGSCIVVA